MPLQSATMSLTMSWFVHDSWSEAYVGTRRLVYELLTTPDASQSAEDSALCQLALIGANRLMEVGLYTLLRPAVATGGSIALLAESLLEDASYYEMFTRWIPALSGKPLDLTAEPFASTERLRRRRNNTIHKSSALATVQMARSALFSAVQGSTAVHSLLGKGFPYQSLLERYVLPNEPWFSCVPFPPGT